MPLLRTPVLALLAVALSACASGAFGPDSGSDAFFADAADATARMDARADAVAHDSAFIDTIGWTDAGADASAVTMRCARAAAVYCAQREACAPDDFARQYEAQSDFDARSHCEDERRRACESTEALPGIGTISDPAACEQALTASCDAFFAADVEPPPACARTPGSVSSGAQCGITDQCQTGLQCYGATPGCQNGVCAMPASAGELCTSESECDTRAGLHCVSALDPDAGTFGEPRCQSVAYGDEGSACRAHSTIQCAAGLLCNASGRCTAYLAQGSACDPAQDLCDVRRGLSCRTGSDGSSVCAAQSFVRVGNACDPEGGASLSCARYTYCDTSQTAAVCISRLGLGEACSGALDNCAPGLICRSGSCRLADPPSCP